MQRRQEKELDIDGLVFDDETEEIAENQRDVQMEETDDMMVDAIAREEEAELEAMLSLLDTTSSLQVPRRPNTPSLSDDEDYDTLFMDMLSQQTDDRDELTLSGQMDMS